MAIPDFFGQQQSSLRSGMQLGQGLQQYKANEQAMDLQSQQADMAQQRFGMEQERFGMEMESAELDIDKRKQAALMRNLLQDTAILTSLGPEEQEKFIEPLKQKYRSVDGMGNAIGELFNKPYKERMESLYTFLHASKDTEPKHMPKTFAPKVDPETGQIYQIEYDPNTRQSRRIDIPGAIAQTPQEIASGEVSRDTQKALYKQAVDSSKAAFDQLPGVRKSISNIDSAISELDKGANTGPVMSMLPSVTEASIALDNIAGQMGLDVIGSTTFGALSEAELKFALDTALPRGLEPKALKEWLTRKKTAQQKLAKELREAAIYLGKGDKTIADYLQSKGPDYITKSDDSGKDEDSRTEEDILSQYGL